MPAWASQWYSPACEATPKQLEEFNTEAVAEAKLDQLMFDWKALAWGLQIPRRLGGNATGAELAMDKKFFRRAMNIQRQAVRVWAPLCPGYEAPTGEPTEFSDEHKKAGAQVNAASWVTTGLERVRAQRATTVTVALQLDLTHWAARAANAFNLEEAGLERLMRLSSEQRTPGSQS